MTAPLRVAHVVCTSSFAGVERQVAEVARGLAARGVDTTVIGGEPAAMRAAVGTDVRWQAGANPWAAARTLRTLARPTIVHAHMTAAETASAFGSHRRGPLVVTRHFAGPRGSSAVARLARPLIERRIDQQLAISAFVADAIGEPSVVLHNGVAPPTVEPGPRERTVLMLQRLEREKETATAVRAWRASGLADSGWRLVVHGRGSEAGGLRRLAAELGVAGSVEFAGFTATPEAALAGSGLLLATARAEPFGLAVVEAMATATPVVATDAGAHPETLGPDGRFFRPGDADGCAAALRTLAADDTGRTRIGAALQARYTELFTLERHLDGLLAIYERLLTEWSRG